MPLHQLTEIFCHIDDFCNAFIAKWHQHLLASGVRKRNRSTSLCPSEIMTILVLFHLSHFRDFKHYYLFLRTYQKIAFPGLPSYQRFIEWIPSVSFPLYAYLFSQMGAVTGISFVDSTPLKVCHNKRIFHHKVFQNLAKRGKSTMGYFFGFKLHLVINERGDLLAFHLTPGNVDDRVPIPKLSQKLWGKLFGDKGYLSSTLFTQLFKKGIQLITSLRSNMKNKLMPLLDKLLLRKRSLIESVNDQLKNVCQIEHSRHRSPINFFVHTLAALTAYSHLPKKPSLKWNLQSSLLPTSPIAL